MTPRARTLLQLLLILLLAGVAIIIFAEYRAGNLSPRAMEAEVAAFGAWAPAAFVLLYALLSGIGFPAIVLSTAGGLLFGKWLGTALNIAGAAAGAAIAFVIARFLLRGWVSRRFAQTGWFGRFEEGVRRNGFHYVLFVRLIPLFPFNGINLAAGISSIRFRHFFAATLIGIAPHAFAFTNAAAELGESAAAGFKITTGLAGALALVAVFALIPLAAKKVIERRRAARGKD